MRKPSHRARALARSLRKICVSRDHLPPTSTASTTRRARVPRPKSSGYVLSFLRRAATKATPSSSAAPRWGSPFACRALNQRGVHSKLGAREEWESVRDHFESPCVPDELDHVQIPHHHIGCHPAACFPADAGCHTPEGITPPPQDPSPGTGCTVVATRIEWEATPSAVLGPRKREVKTAEEEDTEHVWLHRCDPRPSPGV